MEEVLVRQMKEGDKASFDLLYEKYKKQALHTAYLITGNLPDSEDVVQETFVKVYLHCRELKNDSGFKSWMMQILVHTAYRMGRRKSKEQPDEQVATKPIPTRNHLLWNRCWSGSRRRSLRGQSGSCRSGSARW